LGGDISNNINYDNMEEKMFIIQPDEVMSERYEYSQMQKDFMRHLVDKISNMGKDLLGNFVIEVDLKDIVKKPENNSQMIDEIKDLMEKPIIYNFIRDNSRIEVKTNLIANLSYQKGTEKIFITMTEEGLRILSENLIEDMN